MKYLKLFENFQDIDSLCNEYEIRKYTINSDGFVDVDGDVNLSFSKLTDIPIKFGKVNGDFICGFNRLTSLEGCPQRVGGYFHCSFNQLLSLEGCPKEVAGDFYCSNNELTSLEGCPKEVGGRFSCSQNKLRTLEGCPKIISRYFDCSNNELTLIDYLPELIEGNIILSNNKIRDIKVEDKNYRFFGKCYLEENPINDLFKYWKGDLQKFIEEIQFEDFIRDGGKSLDITRFEYALNGKRYNKRSIKNYKLIYKE